MRIFTYLGTDDMRLCEVAMVVFTLYTRTDKRPSGSVIPTVGNRLHIFTPEPTTGPWVVSFLRPECF